MGVAQKGRPGGQYRVRELQRKRIEAQIFDFVAKVSVVTVAFTTSLPPAPALSGLTSLMSSVALLDLLRQSN